MKSGKMHEMGHTSNSEFHAFPLKQWTEMTHKRRLIKCHNSLDNCHRMMIQVSLERSFQALYNDTYIVGIC